MTDYGDENPLLYDYYGFQPALYQLKFKSRGDSALSQRVVQLYKDVSEEIRSQGAVGFQDLSEIHPGWLSGKNNFEARTTRSGRPRVQRPWA